MVRDVENLRSITEISIDFLNIRETFAGILANHQICATPSQNRRVFLRQYLQISAYYVPF